MIIIIIIIIIIICLAFSLRVTRQLLTLYTLIRCVVFERLDKSSHPTKKLWMDYWCRLGSLGNSSTTLGSCDPGGRQARAIVNMSDQRISTWIESLKRLHIFSLVVQISLWEGIFVHDKGLNCTSLEIVRARKYITQIFFEVLLNWRLP